jgi:dolichol-phosphate mannosyltransferase
MKRKGNEFCVIIPAFNEGDRVSEVIKQVKKFKLTTIVVDDGSSDDTFTRANRSKAIVLRHKINLGKGAALKTGCEAAFALGANAIVVLDADGQHNPAHVPKFTNTLSKGYDIVFGYRDLAGKAPPVRYFGNKVGSYLIAMLFNIYRRDLLCGYFAFTKEAYKKIVWKSTRYGVETEIVARTGKNKLKYAEVPIETIYIDKYKGVSILDALSIFPSVFKWRFLE